MSSEEQKFLIMTNSNLLAFSFINFAFSVVTKKSWPNPESKVFFLFSSRNILDLTFRMMIHFALYCEYDARN